MHDTSYLKFKHISDAYISPMCQSDGTVRVLDIGSKRYLNHKTYRDALPTARVEYVGLDLDAGDNVDVVPKSPFVLSEIETETFDACVSGQTFEHNPAFWITFAEMARVLKPGGLAVVIAPGRGAVHRFPVDCWRFYPDAWPALCDYVGLEIVETLFEEYAFDRTTPGAQWCDSTVVARKPELTGETRTAYYARLQTIAATAPQATVAHNPGPGRALQAFMRETKTGLWQSVKRRAKPRDLVQRVLRYL